MPVAALHHYTIRCTPEELPELLLPRPPEAPSFSSSEPPQAALKASVPRPSSARAVFVWFRRCGCIGTPG